METLGQEVNPELNKPSQLGTRKRTHKHAQRTAEAPHNTRFLGDRDSQ